MLLLLMLLSHHLRSIHGQSSPGGGQDVGQVSDGARRQQHDVWVVLRAQGLDLFDQAGRMRCQARRH